MSLAFLRAFLAMLQLFCMLTVKLSAAGTLLRGLTSEGWPIGCHPLLSQKGINPVARVDSGLGDWFQLCYFVVFGP